MKPTEYVPAYLEQRYLSDHPELTASARELLHRQVAENVDGFAKTTHEQALVSYMRVQDNLAKAQARMEELPDEEFEREQIRVYDGALADCERICQADPLCMDAQLLKTLLSNVALDTCLERLVALEADMRAHLARSLPDMDPSRSAGRLFPERAPEDAERIVRTDPSVIAWIHTLEAISTGSLATARYSVALEAAQVIMRAEGNPEHAERTCLLALARLEDEEAFFETADLLGDQAEDSPWYLLGRTLLLYKLQRPKSARRALRAFSERCDGGAFFLLNPTYHAPYLPVREEETEPWRITHQAVWEADGIIADCPDFTAWCQGVEDVPRAAEAFARRRGLI
ncbi:MAG: hypothetical protein Q4B30_01500 [Coriobacteriaceae bacterium]|nr:hypothetical protein [Coriobacteriaceae bacterium]